MTVIDVPQSATTPRLAARSVGVTGTTAYLSGSHRLDRTVTLRGDLWFGARIEQSLNGLLALPQGWDGRRGSPITLQAVAALMDVLQRVLTPASVPPQLVPLPDGGVQAEWLVGGDGLEIEVTGEGELFVFGADGDGTVAVDGGLDEETLLAAGRRLGRLSERVWAVA